MMRTLFATLLVALPVTAFPSGSSAVMGNDAGLFPPSTVFYVELAQPDDLVSLVLDHPLREKIESLPPYQIAKESPQYKRFLAGRMMVEGQLQMPWREALAALLAKQTSFGFDSQSNGAALIFRGKDAESMKLFHDKLLEFARLGENRDKITEGEYRGISAYQIDGARYAVHEDRIVVTNNSELGKRIIDRILDGGDSLADNSRFQSAHAQRDEDAAAWGFVDVQHIRDGGAARNAFEDQINNPVIELLVGGIQSTLKKTPYATISLDAETSGAALSVSAPYQPDWIPEEREYFFGPAGTGRGPALPANDKTLFTLSTYRDFSEMWLRAGDLFNAEINDGFAKADANLTTLFAGRDFGEDILGSFEPEVGFIATHQDFTDVLPRPTIKLPAFAAVFELKEPEAMTRELRRIFQSLVGFLNIVGAMNGQNQLELDMEKVGDDSELVTSSYVPEDDDRESTTAHITFNFSPSVGFSGSRFVVSSTRQLARELTTAKPPADRTIADNTRAQLHAGVLREVLDDNREQLISQNMLTDGNSREEASAIIDLLSEVVGYFENASLSLGSAGESLEAELRIQVKQ